MSLLVHLPLNGNLENKGLSDVTITNTGATVDDDGKIGKCYKFDPDNSSSGQKYLLLNKNLSDILPINGKSFSFACWIKITGKLYSNGCGLIAANQYRTTGVGLYINSTKRIHIHMCYNGTEQEWSAAKMTALQNNVWYHVTYTYNETGRQMTVYINGVNVDSTTANNVWATRDAKILIGIGTQGGWQYTLPGFMNDVRIYDHCLSPKEVKEISKGLVLHYKLDDIYNSSTLQNKYSGNSFLGDASYYTTFVKTKLSDEVGYNYKLNYTGTGSNKWFYLKFPEFEFTPDTMHQYSVYVRCNSKENINNLDLRAARIPNDYHTGLVFINTITNTDNEWHRYELSLIIPTSHVYSGTTYESHPLIELVTDNLNGNGTLYSLDIDLKFIQVVENSEKVPVIDNTLFTNKVYDSSGYNNSGTVIGNLTANSNSSRYNYSTVFNGSSSINAGHNAKVKDAITVSIWAYMDTWTLNHRMISCTQKGGWTFYAPSNTLLFYIGTGTSSNTYNGAGTITAAELTSGWHHFVGTYDGTHVKLYVDGELNLDVTAYLEKTPIYYSASAPIQIGAESQNSDIPTTPHFNGSLSDVRIYATALSAEDVKELYDTAAYITNGGDMCAYEFGEDETSPTIEKTGVVKVDNLYENGTEITLDEELTRFGLDYITSENFNEI